MRNRGQRLLARSVCAELCGLGQLPQARGWPLPSAVWKLEPQAQDLVAFGLKMEKPLFMMSST